MWEWFTTREGNIALGAVLGAGGTIIAQAASGVLGTAKELWLLRTKRRWDARHLALRTILSLDEFVGQCYGAAFDSPEFDPRDNTTFQFRNAAPNLVMPEDADWRLLEPKLMEDVMWLPSHFHNVKDGLNALDCYPPDFNNLFEHRAEDYAKLGMRSLDLIDRLCREYGIQKPERPDYYDPEEGFQRKINEIAAFWKQRQGMHERMFANPPPLPVAVKQ